MIFLNASSDRLQQTGYLTLNSCRPIKRSWDSFVMPSANAWTYSMYTVKFERFLNSSNFYMFMIYVLDYVLDTLSSLGTNWLVKLIWKRNTWAERHGLREPRSRKNNHTAFTFSVYVAPDQRAHPYRLNYLVRWWTILE